MSNLSVPSAARRHRDSPRVRRLAREAGVDLERVRRSGRHGRATSADVAEAARLATEVGRPATAPQPVPQAAGGGRVEPLSPRQRLIAEQVLESLRRSAQLTTVVEVDLTRVSRVRDASELVFVAEAAVLALRSHPLVHARLDLDAGTITYPPAVHLGIAVDTEHGRVVAVVPHADDLSVAGLARRIEDLASGARNGATEPDQLFGATFTVTNTGGRGALLDTPVITPPQSAVLDLGAVVRRPAVVVDSSGQERLAIRSLAYLALSYDHRLIDGADASRFLAAIKSRLERWDVGSSLEDVDGAV